MFERFTERARQVTVLAQDEARGMKYSYIGSEHLLLGLLREQEGLAARALESLGIEEGDLREFIIEIVGQGHVAAIGKIPFTPRAKKVLELALREALSLGHNYIGTEHILLGLVRENEGVAARYLLARDVSAEQVREAIMQALSPRKAEIRIHLDASSVIPASVRAAMKTAMGGTGGNGELNEKTVAVIEQTMYETDRDIHRLKREIGEMENGLAEKRAALHAAESTMAALAESVGSEFSADMQRRVVSR